MQLEPQNLLCWAHLVVTCQMEIGPKGPVLQYTINVFFPSKLSGRWVSSSSSKRGLSQIWLQIRLEKESKKVNESCYICWQHARTYCLNMAIQKKNHHNAVIMCYIYITFVIFKRVFFPLVTRIRNFTIYISFLGILFFFTQKRAKFVFLV